MVLQNFSVSYGSVAAAGNQILRVCFGEFIADGYGQIRGLRISPPKPGNFSKGDAQTQTMSFSVRPTRDARYKSDLNPRKLLVIEFSP
jgi:hypothetical protein